MAEFKPTAAQRAAIESRGSAILVSAGAGSGKTRVLTQRLMGYITDPVHPADLDSFLIISFTRAAAGELRGRITEEISARLASEPDNRRLRRQSALVPRAQIGTIHSFCAALLRQYCHMLGLSPDFKIVDEDRAAAMKQSALERVLDGRYEKKNDAAFLRLADSVGAGQDDRRLADAVLSLHAKIQCHARPELWARQQTELLKRSAADAGDTLWGQEILHAAGENAAYWRAELERLMALMADSEKIAKAYLPAISGGAELIGELERCLRLGWDRARECFPMEFSRLGVLRSSPDPSLSDMIKTRWAACKKAMGGLEAVFASPSEKLLADIAHTAPAMSALLELTLEFDAAYSRDKRRAGLVDYSDLEHMVAKLLTNEDGSASTLALSLSQNYTEIMVDEYQDVSRVQDSIFHAISANGKKLFLVGDVKQSIYRFRLADPGIFTEKYLGFADCEKALPGAPRRILLQENFRSRREVIDCVNAVFSLCMSRALGDLDYDGNAALKVGASYEGGVTAPELMLLSLPGSGDDEESPDKLALEAHMVGRKILELMDVGVKVSGRPLEFGDIALLMRSANSVGGVYRRELAGMGIPVSAGQSGGFFSSVEVSTLVSLLAVTDNPHQDIALIAVLRSPALGFDADELSAIRAKDKKSDFYTALKIAAGADAKGKCARFMELLRSFRTLAADIGVGELLAKMIEALDMYAICAAMPESARRRERLSELLLLAESFEGTGYRGLHRFVLWLRQLERRGQEPGGSAAGSAVQIMTVHKSKGLEFPVVFLCDTARRFNRQDSMDKVLVHPRLGLGPKLCDLERRIEYPTLARNAIRLRLEREMLSEEMRLLYVALTRARERLYITAAMKEPEAFVEKCALAAAKPLAPELLAAASAPVNWLVCAALADGQQHLKISFQTAAEAGEQSLKEYAAAEADAEVLALLERQLDYRYPHKLSEELPSKLTATELKGRREADEDAGSIAPVSGGDFRMPELGWEEKPLTGARRGIATHLALQYMDFARTGSREELAAEAERLCAEGFISRAEAEAVDLAALEKLFASPLGQRMLHADALRREFKFSLMCSAREILGVDSEEELLLQGVVDCCMEEAGKLVIIDYKTDRVRSDEQLAEKGRFYTPQLRSYARAMARIFGMEVSECVLYFLSVGKEVKIAKKDLQ